MSGRHERTVSRFWHLRQIAVGAAVLLVLAACGGGATPTSLPPSTSTPIATITPTTAITPVATASRASSAATTRVASPIATATRGTMTYPDVVRLAIEALAGELGVPREQITVARFEARDWPDTALGCPQPGRAYLQVVTPGYRVFLVAGGREYEYHTNRTNMVTRCSS